MKKDDEFQNNEVFMCPDIGSNSVWHTHQGRGYVKEYGLMSIDRTIELASGYTMNAKIPDAMKAEQMEFHHDKLRMFINEVTGVYLSRDTPLDKVIEEAESALIVNKKRMFIVT